MIISKNNSQIIVRIRRGNYIVKTLESVTISYAIKAASFFGIGALDGVELAHYNVFKKKYSTRKFKQELELVSLIGNIAWFEGKPLIHAHATLSDPNMKPIAGHFVEGRVSGTCEISLNILNIKIEKTLDPETGLKVIKNSI